MLDAASTTPRRRILWQNVSTVMSAAVLISAEVFGAAFAGGWALANVLGIGDFGIYAVLRRRPRRDGELRAQCHADRTVRGARLIINEASRQSVRTQR
jgi:hypothetical protein